jgi:GNAT superfamily N-acetyltransferase
VEVSIITEEGFPSRAEELRRERMWIPGNDSLFKALLTGMAVGPHRKVIMEVRNSVVSTAYALMQEKRSHLCTVWTDPPPFIVGWALRFEKPYGGIAVYVKPKYRRQGIGTRLQASLITPEDEEFENPLVKAGLIRSFKRTGPDSALIEFNHPLKHLNIRLTEET